MIVDSDMLPPTHGNDSLWKNTKIITVQQGK